MSSTTISIALCTYHGARYVLEQLESIAAQTLLPDEIVVCDDCSTDETAEIINTFGRRAPFPVHLYLNEHNLGSTKNFERAISLCAGEIILLSDQDDVWDPRKLERIRGVFSDRPHIGSVLTDAKVVDDELCPLPYTLWQFIKFTRAEQRDIRNSRAFDVLLRHNVATGATLAFRSQFRPLILPIPELWVHDGWIALLIAAVGAFDIIESPLISYRQHAGNQLGAVKKKKKKPLRSFSDIYWDRIQRFTLARERLVLKRKEMKVPEHLIVKLEQKIQHLQTRGALPRSRWGRLPIMLRELFALRYHRYHRGTISFSKDLLRSVP